MESELAATTSTQAKDVERAELEKAEILKRNKALVESKSGLERQIEEAVNTERRLRAEYEVELNF